MTDTQIEPIAPEEDLVLAKRLAEVKRLAELQGIPVNNAFLAASAKELKELEALVQGVQWAAANPDIFTDPLKALQSLPKGVSLNGIAGAAHTIKDSVSLFDEYIVNAAKKSYDNLMKIKNDKESTNFDFFKGCINCAADMFFAIQTFRKEAQKKHPGLIAVEVLFAPQLAPVYAAVTAFSTILSICGYKDNTAELIKGGKELREKARKVKEIAEEITKEQGGISVEAFANSCKALDQSKIFDDIAAVASGAKTLVDVAANFQELEGLPKERATEFVKKMSDIVLEIPRSKDDVDAFAARMVPDAKALTENQLVVFDALKAKLAEINDGTPPVERVTATALALQKFTNSLTQAGGKISEPLKLLSDKITTACDPLVKKDRSLDGAAVNGVARDIGCGKAFVFAVTELSKTINKGIGALATQR